MRSRPHDRAGTGRPHTVGVASAATRRLQRRRGDDRNHSLGVSKLSLYLAELFFFTYQLALLYSSASTYRPLSSASEARSVEAWRIRGPRPRSGRSGFEAGGDVWPDVRILRPPRNAREHPPASRTLCFASVERESWRDARRPRGTIGGHLRSPRRHHTKALPVLSPRDAGELRPWSDSATPIEDLRRGGAVFSSNLRSPTTKARGTARWNQPSKHFSTPEEQASTSVHQREEQASTSVHQRNKQALQYTKTSNCSSATSP